MVGRGADILDNIFLIKNGILVSVAGKVSISCVQMWSNMLLQNIHKCSLNLLIFLPSRATRIANFLCLLPTMVVGWGKEGVQIGNFLEENFLVFCKKQSVIYVVCGEGIYMKRGFRNLHAIMVFR